MTNTVLQLNGRVKIYLINHLADSCQLNTITILLIIILIINLYSKLLYYIVFVEQHKILKNSLYVFLMNV